jgi:hypothetical protein
MNVPSYSITEILNVIKHVWQRFLTTLTKSNAPTCKFWKNCLLLNPV